MMTVGQCMKEARKKARLTQRQLADMADMSPTLLCAYENDRITPGLFNVIELADILGLTLDKYVGHQVSERGGTQ